MFTPSYYADLAARLTARHTARPNKLPAGGHKPVDATLIRGIISRLHNRANYPWMRPTGTTL